MRALMIGATSGMGRAMARLMAARGDSLHLLGFDMEDLEKTAADLRARSAGANVTLGLCNLENPEEFEPAIAKAEEALSGLDTVIITAGMFGTQEKLESDLVFASRLLRVNFTNTIIFCEMARKRLIDRGGGTLCVFSSVAGDKGRKTQVIYGASKGGLSRYLEGLDLRYRSMGLKTVCVKPGFVNTPMTAGLKPPPFAGEPDEVAARALKAIDKGKPLVYCPWQWRCVMMIIRHLPRFVMRRVDF